MKTMLVFSPLLCDLCWMLEIWRMCPLGPLSKLAADLNIFMTMEILILHGIFGVSRDFHSYKSTPLGFTLISTSSAWLLQLHSSQPLCTWCCFVAIFHRTAKNVIYIVVDCCKLFCWQWFLNSFPTCCLHCNCQCKIFSQYSVPLIFVPAKIPFLIMGCSILFSGCVFIPFITTRWSLSNSTLFSLFCLPMPRIS